MCKHIVGQSKFILNRHAIVEVYAIVVIDVTNDDAVIVRSVDGWRNCFTGRTEEQET